MLCDVRVIYGPFFGPHTGQIRGPLGLPENMRNLAKGLLFLA